jgi:hypothetical protein
VATKGSNEIELQSIICQTQFLDMADMRPPIVIAAKDNNIEELKKLIDAGVVIDEPTEYGTTALIMASGRGHVNCVELLLAVDAVVHATDVYGNGDALHIACYAGRVECIDLLLAAGADVEHLDLFDNTALAAACLCKKKSRRAKSVKSVLAAMEMRTTPAVHNAIIDCAMKRAEGEVVDILNASVRTGRALTKAAKRV